MSKKLRTALSEENIKEILHDNLEYFRNIESGSEEIQRFKAYYSGRNDQHLNFKQIGEPFSERQQEIVFDAVKSIWLKDKIMDRFVDVVILPEVFLRIYQKNN